MAMFDGSKEGELAKETIIGTDVTVTGNMKSSANIQINGNIKGKIDTDNDILIGETALIEGSLKAKNVIVTGTVKGNIDAAEDLEIAPTGKVFGDVVTKNLIIKKGSVFVGKTTMPSSEAPADSETEKGEAGEEMAENQEESSDALLDQLEKAENQEVDNIKE